MLEAAVVENALVDAGAIEAQDGVAWVEVQLDLVD